MPMFRKIRRARPQAGAAEEGAREVADAPVVPVGAVVRRGPNLAAQLRAIAEQATLPEDAFEPALQAILEATGASAGALCLFDVRYGILRLTTEVGLSDEGCRRLRSVRRGDPASWDMPLHGLLNRRAYLIESAARNRYVPRLLTAGAPVRTVACVPLYAETTPLGSLVLVTVAPRAFVERDIQALWRPLAELVRMIEAVRRQVGAGGSEIGHDLPPPPRRFVPTPDVVTLTAERDRLLGEVTALRADQERFAVMLREHAQEVESLRTAVAESGAERDRLRGEVERARSDDRVARLTASLEAAERERERLAAALEAAASLHSDQVKRESMLDEARREAQRLAETHAHELERVRAAGDERAVASERVARERQEEIERLRKRSAELETQLQAERDREHGFQAELARLTAAQQAAATREKQLHEELERVSAGRAAEDADVATARSLPRRASHFSIRPSLTQSARRPRAGGGDRDGARDDARGARGARRASARAQAEIARLEDGQRAAAAEQERLASLVATHVAAVREACAERDRLAAELAAVREDYERSVAGSRQREAEGAAVGARLEMLAAERDQLRALLATAEEERERVRAEAGTQLATLESQLRGAQREHEAALSRLVAERDRLALEHDRLLAEREALESKLAAAEADVSPLEIPAPEAEGDDDVAADADGEDDVAAAIPMPEPGALDDAEPDDAVIAIAVTDAVAQTPKVEPGKTAVVVLDVQEAWADATLAEHQVIVLPPDGGAGEHIAAVEPERVIVNLAAPGALQAMMALRAAGCSARFWGCIADPRAGHGLALGPVEPAVAPLDPDAVIETLGLYAGQGGRVVTTGADVDALMSLRQALSRRRVSVSMAWDGKQAAELLSVVKPLAVVVDLDLPRRDGYSVIAALGAIEPIPYAVVVGGSDDAPAALRAQLTDGTNARRLIPLAQIVSDLLARIETTPVVERKQKVRVIQGTGR
ncbi:MAG: GAF domain-containing protein [bacterium]|nr:GAF domain-containing protein [bacterium]